MANSDRRSFGVEAAGVGALLVFFLGLLDFLTSDNFCLGVDDVAVVLDLSLGGRPTFAFGGRPTFFTSTLTNLPSGPRIEWKIRPVSVVEVFCGGLDDFFAFVFVDFAVAERNDFAVDDFLTGRPILGGRPTLRFMVGTVVV